MHIIKKGSSHLVLEMKAAMLVVAAAAVVVVVVVVVAVVMERLVDLEAAAEIVAAIDPVVRLPQIDYKLR